MPPAIRGVKLEEVGPNAEELEHARAILAKASAAEVKSKKSGLHAFLLKHPDPKAQASRGADRQRYLENFLVHQARAKGNQKKSHTTESASSATHTLKDPYWWALEKM